MRLSASKWLLIFVYLVITLPIGIFISAAIMQILINLFYFVFYESSLNLLSIDYIKILKGSIGGGVIGAIGCWWIYYRHYRKKSNK